LPASLSNVSAFGPTPQQQNLAMMIQVSYRGPGD
jgi:hypothetical protein